MHVTRAEFLATLSGGLAIALLEPANLLAAPRVADMRAEHFRAHLQTVFRVGTSAGERELVLVKVTERQFSTNTDQFCLEFVSQDGVQLREGTYPVENEELGRFQIYLAPVRTEGAGKRTYFRADFNKLR